MANIVYVNEYEPSKAQVTIGNQDPLYKKSANNEAIYVRKLAPTPSPLAIILGIGVVGAVGIALYYAFKK